MVVDEEELESSREMEIITIKNLLIHKINSLKLVSQSVHSNYLVFGAKTARKIDIKNTYLIHFYS